MADGCTLSSTSGSLGVLLHSSNRRLCHLSGTAAATGTTALATGLGDVIERLVELGRHVEWRENRRLSIGNETRKCWF